MQHHLRMADRPAREVEEHRVLVRRRRLGNLAVARRVHQCVEVVPALAPAAPGDPVAQRVRRLLDRVDLLHARRVGDRHHRIGAGEAVRDVPRRQLVGPGHRHRADPDRAEHRRVPRRHARQHHEDRIALLDSQREQRPRRAPRLAREVGRGLLGDDPAPPIQRDERHVAGRLVRPALDDVDHRVEALGHVDTEARALRLVVRQTWCHTGGRGRLRHGSSFVRAGRRRR